MRQVVQLRGGDIPLVTRSAVCTLAIPIEEVAARLGLEVEEWEEDGLGTARGAFVRIASKRVLLLSELVHARRHLGSKGPAVEVDLDDLDGSGGTGAAAVLLEVTEGLGLQESEIDWRHPGAITTHQAIRSQ